MAADYRSGAAAEDRAKMERTSLSIMRLRWRAGVELCRPDGRAERAREQDDESCGSGASRISPIRAGVRRPLCRGGAAGAALRHLAAVRLSQSSRTHARAGRAGAFRVASTLLRD